MSFRLVYSRRKPSRSKGKTHDRASGLSQPLVSRMISQELRPKFDAIDSELGVRAAKMSDELTGRLVYTAALFVWKFVVESVRSRYSERREQLQNKKEEMAQIFGSVALNVKEHVPVIEINRRLSNQIRLANSKQIGRIKKHLKAYLSKPEVKGQYDGRAIREKLRKRTFKRAKAGKFKKAFKLMTSPEAVIDQHISKLNKRHFENKIEKKSTKRLAKTVKLFAE